MGAVPWVGPYLEPAPGALRRGNDFPPAPQRNLRDEVLACVELARARGLEMLVPDQTRDDVELAVVKVVVPGLRPFWPRFAPGRLYDVPLERGWVQCSRSEEEINPIFLLI